MDNQPTVDRSLLIPILLSGFSVIGIVIVLLIGRSLSAPPEVPMTPSATRFSYVYLGTEPAVSTPLIEDTESVITDEPIFEEPTEPQATQGTPTPPVFQTPTRPGPLTPIVLPSATGILRTNTPTATSAAGPALNAGIYDDVDSHFVYSGSWSASNVAGAYKDTLHVSISPGPPASTISFWFIGRQLRLKYQGGQTLGQIRITIDAVSENLDQSSGSEWVSDTFTNGTHTVLITHVGGGSVNLDQVIIPEPVGTPTVTPTPTRTPNL